jgi:hypothetical protein
LLTIGWHSVHSLAAATVSHRRKLEGCSGVAAMHRG